MKTLTVSKCPQITSWVFRAHSSKILAIVGRQPFHTYNLYRICEELLKWVAFIEGGSLVVGFKGLTVDADRFEIVECVWRDIKTFTPLRVQI